MATTRFALIVVGTRNDAWGKLSRSKQSEFIAHVEQATRSAGVVPVNGYRLSATPGAFIEIWEGVSRAGIDRAIKGLQAMGYTRYVAALFQKQCGHALPGVTQVLPGTVHCDLALESSPSLAFNFPFAP